MYVLRQSRWESFNDVVLNFELLRINTFYLDSVAVSDIFVLMNEVMRSDILVTTVQAGLINILSNLLAQNLTAYQQKARDERIASRPPYILAGLHFNNRHSSASKQLPSFTILFLHSKALPHITSGSNTSKQCSHRALLPFKRKRHQRES